MLCCTHRWKRVQTESLNYTIRWKDNIKNDHKEISPENINGLNLLSTVSIGGVLCVDTIFKAYCFTALWQMTMRSLTYIC
jgi:hypothetical protein